MFRIVDHPRKGICVAHGCKNNSTQKDRFCAKHRHRYNKANNPYRYTYQVTKCNAKRRGHKFTITFEDFKEWCIENKYLELKGRTASKASIDRIDPLKGYEKGNLQILTVSENSIKGHEERGDCPF